MLQICQGTGFSPCDPVCPPGGVKRPILVPPLKAARATSPGACKGGFQVTRNPMSRKKLKNDIFLFFLNLLVPRFFGARSAGLRTTEWDVSPKVNPRTRGQGKSPFYRLVPGLVPGGSKSAKKPEKTCFWTPRISFYYLHPPKSDFFDVFSIFGISHGSPLRTCVFFLITCVYQ